jgi:NADH:ubiquinone oxidoreductase subunit F (NADH-binding)
MTSQATSPVVAGVEASATVIEQRGSCPLRLLRDDLSVESEADYRASGGYAAITDPRMIATLALEADLCGRGGAGFPLGRKLATVSASPDPYRIVVANGEEGEPGSVKDRVLLRSRPHLVLDGLRLAGLAVDATDLHVYVSDPAAAAIVQAALTEVPALLPAVTVTTVAPAYVAGEESAVVRYLDGGPALPTAKPPRAFEVGVGGHPTVVSNVETLAQLAMAVSHGVVAYHPGSVLVTVSGDALAPRVVEAARGTVLSDIVGAADVRGVLCGGLFGGLQPASALELPLDHAAMKAAGTSMGCGAFHVMSSRGCPVELVTDAVSYLARQSAQQCGVCFKGTASMASTLQQLVRGEADAAALDPLVRWSTGLKGRGNCALLDAACELVGSLFRNWQADVDAHLVGAECPVCTSRTDFTETRLAVSPDPFLPPPLQERP